MEPHAQKNETIDALNELLRGEISACETYKQALKALPGLSTAEIQQAFDSHEMRAGTLRDRIQALGGKADESSGVWGAFVRIIQGGADLLGPKAALAALEEGEDRGLKDYRSLLAKLDPDTRMFVETRLLPEQERSHAIMSSAKRGLH